MPAGQSWQARLLLLFCYSAATLVLQKDKAIDMLKRHPPIENDGTCLLALDASLGRVIWTQPEPKFRGFDTGAIHPAPVPNALIMPGYASLSE